MGTTDHIIPLTRTLLPPNRYAELMSIQPQHFNQMAGALAPLNDGCDSVWDHNDREDLVWALAQAEELIAEFLRYWPAPKFITNEEISFDGSRSIWENAQFKTRYGYVQSFGTETLTLKEADVPIAYEDLNNNPFNRISTATLVTGGLYSAISACDNACEVAVFFREDDGAEDISDSQWEIRPIKVDIDDATMTIRINPAYLIKPSLLSLMRDDCLFSDDTNAWIYNFTQDNLVTHVDVYCRTVNTESPLTIKWDGVCRCTSACSHETQTGCAIPVNNRKGSFLPRPSSWNGSANVLAAASNPYLPLLATANYYAGYSTDRYCRLNRNLERAIVKLTNSLMPEPDCHFCDLALRKWKYDRSIIDPLTPEGASLPWDLYTQGALDAWRIVKRMGLGTGGKLGR